MKLFIQLTLLSLLFQTTFTHADTQPIFSCCASDNTHIGRPDEHAPISVMNDHTHSKDSWMVSYRYMYMDMDGMRRVVFRGFVRGIRVPELRRATWFRRDYTAEGVLRIIPEHGCHQR